MKSVAPLEGNGIDRRRWAATAMDGDNNYWAASVVGGWLVMGGGGRRLADNGRSAERGLPEVDMWHSVLDLKGVALCVILMFF
ncbi:hypothetical protein ACE6H2_011198 [Prunus campanulata]